ncbi:GPI mannosyltransferase 2 isoform X2 [Pieris napi]|uniref:GPI mannosyltransferase 2 isoform X2 n=1 Tax=Pieris napi TaxID=78633 RepID=UPI001FBB83D6|nr:GPI mannosyltransferase 2 isoform X2 [Pieris napi]
MYSPRQKILWFAFNTRIFIILLQAVFNAVIPDHDANVFISPEDPTLRKTSADSIIEKIFGGLKRWDGNAESPWCNKTLPVSYSYIQSHYWNVGLFKYYQIKQLPNFILALPVLVLILYNCLSYVKNNIRLFLRLGLKDNISYFGYTTKISCRPKQYSKGFGTNDPVYFVYVVHVMFLTIFSIMFVHIQVTTRLLASASPVLYWICSNKINVGPTPTSDQNTINEHFRRIGMGKRIPSHHLSIANLEGVDNMYSKWKTFIITRRMPDLQSRFIQCYFIGYVVTGTVLFCNFLPWT